MPKAQSVEHFPWTGITEERVVAEMEKDRKTFSRLHPNTPLSYNVVREVTEILITISATYLKKWSGAELLVGIDLDGVVTDDFAAPDCVDFCAAIWREPEPFWEQALQVDLGFVLSSFQFMALLFFLSPIARKSYKKALAGVDLLFRIHPADSTVTIYHHDASGMGRNLWSLMVASTRDRYSK